MSDTRVPVAWVRLPMPITAMSRIGVILEEWCDGLTVRTEEVVGVKYLVYEADFTRFEKTGDS